MKTMLFLNSIIFLILNLNCTNDNDSSVNTNIQPDPHLIAHYLLDGNGVDSSIYAFNAKDTNVLWQEGIKDTAVYLTGNSSYIKVDDTLGKFIDTNFTLCVWIKPNDSLTPYPIFEFTDTINKAGLHIWINTQGYAITTPGAVQVNLREKILDDSHNFFTKGSLIIEDTWNHLVITFDGDSGKVFINGQIIVQNKFLKKFKCATSFPLFIGYRPESSGDNMQGSNFIGNIDDIRIYDIELSKAEILKLYQNVAR